MSLKLFQFCLNPVPLLSSVLSFYGNIQWRRRCSDFSSDWRFTPLYTLSRRLVARKTLNVFFSKINFHKTRQTHGCTRLLTPVDVFSIAWEFLRMAPWAWFVYILDVETSPQHVYYRHGLPRHAKSTSVESASGPPLSRGRSWRLVRLSMNVRAIVQD